MKVAVLGSRGMAGHMISRYLDGVSGITVDRYARSGDGLFDITDSSTVRALIKRLDGVDYIVNCTGLLVADSLARPDLASLVNSWFPHHLENSFSGTGTRIIHLSTDCVFDGSSGYYSEDHPSTEQNYYGKSKSLGEINNSKDITFRTSIIGPELTSSGSGLLNWFINRSGAATTGYTDALWNGVTTLQLARCVYRWMLDPRVTGVRHVVNNSVNISKYDLLCLINEIWGLGKTVSPGRGSKPVNKILVDTRGDYDWGIPDYRTQLKELSKWL